MRNVISLVLSDKFILEFWGLACPGILGSTARSEATVVIILLHAGTDATFKFYCGGALFDAEYCSSREIESFPGVKTFKRFPAASGAHRLRSDQPVLLDDK